MTLVWQEATSTYAPVATVGDPGALDAKRVALGASAPAMRAEPIRVIDERTLAITLRNGADTVGVQLVATEQPIGPEHLRIAEGVAAIAAIALANAHLIDRLAEASRLKSEFVSTMSHELRTPLNVILGYCEMVGDAASDAERAELLERIEIAGRDLLDLIE